MARRAVVSGSGPPPERTAPVNLELSGESIYAHSLLRLRATGTTPFSLRLHGARLVDVERGRLSDDDRLEADSSDGGYRVEVRLIGWMQERPIGDARAEGPEHRYGMRFYPFVSSHLRGTIEVEGASIDHLLLDLPDRFRVIWFQQAVLAPLESGKTDAAELHHSYGEERSQFVFLWSTSGARSAVSLDVPLRLGAATLAELVLYPALYLTLSLLGIALAAIAASVSVVIAAIGATWTFTLRQWTNARLPQQSTLLTAGYVGASVFVLAWGLTWEAAGWPAAGLAAPLVGGLAYLRRVVAQFRETGTLPSRLTSTWRWYVVKRVTRDQAAAIGGRPRD